MILASQPGFGHQEEVECLVALLSIWPGCVHSLGDGSFNCASSTSEHREGD